MARTKNDKRTAYDVLGVPKDADAAQIKRAYRKKAQQTHPDAGGQTDEMAEINEAFRAIGDPGRRLLYDQTGSDSAAKPIEEEAIGALVQLFNDLLRADHITNVIESAREFVRMKQQEFLKEKQKAEAKRKKLDARRSSVICKNGENLFHAVIDRQLQEIDWQIAKLDRDTEIGNAVLRILKSYKSTTPDLTTLTTTTFRISGISFTGSTT